MLRRFAFFSWMRVHPRCRRSALASRPRWPKPVEVSAIARPASGYTTAAPPRRRSTAPSCKVSGASSRTSSPTRRHAATSSLRACPRSILPKSVPVAGTLTQATGTRAGSPANAVALRCMPTPTPRESSRSTAWRCYAAASWRNRRRPRSVLRRDAMLSQGWAAPMCLWSQNKPCRSRNIDRYAAGCEAGTPNGDVRKPPLNDCIAVV